MDLEEMPKDELIVRVKLLEACLVTLACELARAGRELGMVRPTLEAAIHDNEEMAEELMTVYARLGEALDELEGEAD